jgi:hypothetical protein
VFQIFVGPKVFDGLMNEELGFFTQSAASPPYCFARRVASLSRPDLITTIPFSAICASLASCLASLIPFVANLAPPPGPIGKSGIVPAILARPVH